MAKIDRRVARQTDKFNSLVEESDAMGEQADCAVKAVALACDVDYKTAHAALKKAGRKNRQGTHFYDACEAIEALGYEVKTVKPHAKIAQYPGVHKNLESVTTHHPDRFKSVWQDGKTYLFRTAGHILTVIDGVNHDHTRGRAMRCMALYEVTKK